MVWKFLIGFFLAGCQPNEIRGPKPVFYERPSQNIPDARPVPRQGFVNLDLLEDTILLDLQSLGSDAEREDTRYLIGCDRNNQGDNMELFTQGIDLALNRLSDERFLTKTTPIGNDGCIYRVDLNDYTLTRQEWRLIENNTILDFVSKSVRNQNIQFLTQTRKPYIFGIETCAMFECDEVADKAGAVYYDLVDQPIDTTEFFATQGVVLQDEVDQERALFSGFSQSQIALGKTRLVQIVESDNGYCMTTFDTALGGDDLFANPFTLELARAGGRINTKRIFDFAAGEHICTTNAGLSVYRLNNNLDVAEGEAPTNIVTNRAPGLPELDPSIRLGDCGNCHFRNAAIPFSDQIRNHVLSNPGFDTNEKELAEIFFNYTRMSAVIDDINRRNLEALEDLDINSDNDPVVNEIFLPMRREMDADQVAAFTFLPTEEFLTRLRGAAISSQVFGNLLNGGRINLATLSTNFPILVDELNLFDDSDL